LVVDRAAVLLCGQGLLSGGPVQTRWLILIVLFLTRLTMAFQFQSSAALSPFLTQAYGVGLADVGLLIGLYLAPGVVVAIPGGAIAARFGDRRGVMLSLGLMLVGGAMAMVGPGWTWVLAGRVLAGIGGVVINIVMTKLLVDWFAGREISTALAIFVNSWPVGIALALVVLPPLAATGGIALAQGFTLGLIATGLLVFATVYRSPPGLAEAAAPSLAPARLPVLALTLAAGVWAFYNAALAVIFSFGPAILTAIGWEVAQASSAISLFMLVFALSVPLGGMIADRTGRRDGVIALSLAAFFLMPGILWMPGAAMPVLIAVAVLFGWAAGPIMTLPAQVLRPEARAFGMGVFFAIYYGVMMIAPGLAGTLAEARGSAADALWLGVALSGIGLACLVGFERSRRATASTQS
jgi:MFS family permease